jgi:hypothetical protein
MLNVRTNLVYLAALVDRAVAIDDEVIADVTELAREMPLADGLDGDVLTFFRC